MTKRILLTRGKFALVDDSDFEWLSQWKWQCTESHGNYYATRRQKIEGKYQYIKMHRVIIDAPGSMMVDHVDGNGLNNERRNLRLTDATGNARNTRARAGSSSRYKGVAWDKGMKAWRAFIVVRKTMKHLGCFEDEKFAARVHDKAAVEYHGEFARENFPEEPAPSDDEIEEHRRSPFKTSRFRGVSWHSQNHNWTVKIQVNRRTIRLGSHQDERLAAQVYDFAAAKYHGEHAMFNFPGETLLSEKMFDDITRGTQPKSQYRGVSFGDGKWVAYIRSNRKQVSLGRFTDEVEAAKAYNEAAIKYHGSKAKLNDV